MFDARRSAEIDCVELRAVALQPGFGLVSARAETTAKRPELRPMVHLVQMSDLVGSEVIDDKRWCHDDAPGEAQIAVP